MLAQLFIQIAVRMFRLDQSGAPTHTAILESTVLFKILVLSSEFSPVLTRTAGDVPSTEPNMSVTLWELSSQI